jgi:putative protein-disulfide isomerase
MDSTDAARGVAALRQAAPDRAVEIAIAVQRAFFVDGLSLSDPDTYRKVAEAVGLDARSALAAMAAPLSKTAAEADFRRSAKLAVTGFPTLLAVADRKSIAPPFRRRRRPQRLVRAPTSRPRSKGWSRVRPGR